MGGRSFIMCVCMCGGSTRLELRITRTIPTFSSLFFFICCVSGWFFFFLLLVFVYAVLYICKLLFYRQEKTSKWAAKVLIGLSFKPTESLSRPIKIWTLLHYTVTHTHIKSEEYEFACLRLEDARRPHFIVLQSRNSTRMKINGWISGELFRFIQMAPEIFTRKSTACELRTTILRNSRIRFLPGHLYVHLII